MNYYYDIVLNFNLDHIWRIYEWDEKDILTYVKKIPLFKVSFETICDFLKYHVVVSKEIVNLLENKTIYEYNEDHFASFLMSDGKNAIAVLLNELGKVISISRLKISDENNLNEFMFTIKEREIDYEIINLRDNAHPLRQKEFLQNIILVELNTLKDEENVLKMKYFYYECFLDEENDLEVMYEKMTKSLKSLSMELLLKIDYLIKLSYHQV